MYECRAEKATRKQLKNNKWEVTLTYSVSKFYADKSGKEIPAPIDGEVFDVNIFAKPSRKRKKDDLLGKSLLDSKKVTISAANVGRSKVKSRKIVYVVSGKPYEAGIDPYNVMIDRTPDNNTILLEEEKRK
ncbi:MAG: hypothetical protein H8F28_25210 [Fibrella sp.]|nr:hypothetical protein [Armatimonadota bacterium]